MTRCVVVDGTNMLIRSFAAYPELTADDGFPTGAIFGMVNRVREAMELFTPSSVLVCWDGGRSAWRRELFPGYKDRPVTGEASPFEKAFRQKPVIIAMLELMGVPQLVLPGVEADDLIAWAVLEYWADAEVQILTTDRDFYQLISERVGVYGGASAGMIHLKTFAKEVKLVSTPMEWHLFRIINGDKSDTIPRVEGLSGKVRFGKVHAMLRSVGYAENPAEFFVDTDFDAEAMANRVTAMDHRMLFDRIVGSWGLVQRNTCLMDLRIALGFLDGLRPLAPKINRGMFDVDAFLATCEMYNFQSVLALADRWRSVLEDVFQKGSDRDGRA